MKNIAFILILLSLTAGNIFAGGPFKVPDYEKFTLDNGLTVYLMEQHEVPLIYVNMVNPAGSMMDGGQSGMASFTAEGLKYGANGKSRSQIEAAFDAKGATFSTDAGVESARLSASFHRDDAREFMAIIADMIIRPEFNEQEFEQAKVRRIANLGQMRESPKSVIGDYFNGFLYGEHPYGNPVSGTVAATEKMTATDLRNFHKEFYIPGLSAIAVVGDFDAKSMKKNLQTLFGKWEGGDDSGFGTQIPTFNFTSNRVLLVDKPDARETTFYIGAKGVKRDNPDYVAIQVINTILGGRFTSWLNDELRVNSGLTYGARSRFDMNKLSGTFYVTSFTKNSTTVDALDLALEVLNRLHEKGIDEETLSSARNYVKGNFPPRYETSGALAGLLTDMFIYGYDESLINNFQKNVDGVTVAKAKEIVAKYFPKGNFQMVLIGKADEIRDKVSKYGTITEKVITEDGF